MSPPVPTFGANTGSNVEVGALIINYSGIMMGSIFSFIMVLSMYRVLAMREVVPADAPTLCNDPILAC